MHQIGVHGVRETKETLGLAAGRSPQNQKRHKQLLIRVLLYAPTVYCGDVLGWLVSG